MELYAFAKGFFIALMIGALIGIEREKYKLKKEKEKPIFGIRTMIFFSIVGFFLSYLNEYQFLAGLTSILLFIIAAYFANAIVKKHTGATTPLAAMIAIFLGILCGWGEYTVAVSTAIIITALLAAKRKLMNISKKITSEELYAALEMGIIAFVILPLLPNRYIDPFNIINPFKIWYVVIAVSAISFVSYIFLKLFQEKGILLSSFFGGWINSSATVYQISEFLKKRASKNIISSGVFMASIAGIISDIAVILFVFWNFKLLYYTLPGELTGVALLTYLVYKNYAKYKIKEIKIKSPFEIKSALEFGAVYTLLLVLGHFLENAFGNFGLATVVTIASIYSSSTVIASIAQLTLDGTINFLTGGILVIIATVISILIKPFWVYLGSKNKEFSKEIGKANTAVSAAIISVLLILLYIIR